MLQGELPPPLTGVLSLDERGAEGQLDDSMPRGQGIALLVLGDVAGREGESCGRRQPGPCSRGLRMVSS
jgi:hypothetical protein